jgi:hypothetical protein
VARCWAVLASVARSMMPRGSLSAIVIFLCLLRRFGRPYQLYRP